MHRLVYALSVGGLRDGQFICHTCNNRGCLNMQHLYQGTPKDNYEDMLASGNAYAWGRRLPKSLEIRAVA